MGINRIVNTDFWKDAKVIDCYTPKEKYFWLYILTNPQTRQLGVYKLPKKLIAFETGYNLNEINTLIKKFQYEYKAIIYSEETQEVAILNYLKYSIVKGGKPVIDCINKDISMVSDKRLMGEIYRHISNTNDERPTITTIIEMLSPYSNDIYNDNDNDNDNDSNGRRNVARIVSETKKKQYMRDGTIQYGEFKNVYLKEDEYQKLLNLYSEQNIKNEIDNLSCYIENTDKGKKYKNHYATLLNWCKRKYKATDKIEMPEYDPMERLIQAKEK